MAEVLSDRFASNEPWWIVVNPAGGNGAVSKSWPQLRKLLDACGYRYELAFTERREHAIELAIRGVEDGYRQVMAVGGDGTNNEVVNGLLQQRVVPPEHVHYALLPVGTGNDWVKTLGIPRDFRKWAPQIGQGLVRRVDVGLVHYTSGGEPRVRYFVNVAGMAYDAFVARYAESKRGMVSNKLLYLYLVMRCLFQYDLRKARVCMDGQTVEDHFYTINVGLGRYSGGGMQFVPHAEPDAGRFAVTLAGNMSKWAVIAATPYFYNGKVGRHPKVTTLTARELEVTAPAGQPPTLLEVDGEFLGETPVRFELLPQRLAVIVPRR